MRREFQLRTKLISMFVLISIVPVLLLGILTSDMVKDALIKRSNDQLVNIRNVKKLQIEQFFEECKKDMGLLVENIATHQENSYQKLIAVRESRKKAVQRYLKATEHQISVFAQNPTITKGLANLSDSFQTFRKENRESLRNQKRMLSLYYNQEFSHEYGKRNGSEIKGTRQIISKLSNDGIALQYHYIQQNPNETGLKERLNRANDRSRYSKIHAEIHPLLRNYPEKFGYSDIFLIDAKSGNIVYTTLKEVDFATSLINGPFANSPLGKAFRKAVNADSGESIIFSDFERYLPSYDEPAAFIATPVFDQGKKVGVVAFQLNPERINAIMTENEGLGKTGESYLVGPDLLMRSDSRLDPQNHNVITSFKNPKKGKIDTIAAKNAIAGETGHDLIIDYNGNPVLSAWTYVDFGDVRWGLLTEIDVDEAFTPTNMKGEEFYKKYKEHYGYYDLFLIHPSGYIFYTVEQEPDYQTNIINGKYEESNLGWLVRNVSREKKLRIADFEPYAPSKGAPASFIAAPLLHNNEIELIVALQIPLSKINTIMNHREGMGKSGEAYLVGKDHKMRSTAHMDRENRTVEASFAGTVEKNGVNTLAVNEALQGVTATKLIQNYNGKLVLSSFTPIKLGHITWSLIAEINEEEILRPVTILLRIIALISIVIIAITSFLGISFSKRVLRQIGGDPPDIIKIAQKVARGDLSVQKENGGKNVTGIHEELLKMVDSLKTKVDAAEKIANGNLATKVSMASEDDVLGKALRKMTKDLNQMMSQILSVTDQLTFNSNNVQLFSQKLSQSSTEQASSIEEISSSTSQIESQTQGNLANITKVDKLSTHSTKHAEEGNLKMQNMQNAMRDINQISGEVTDVVKTIDEIAFQTNVLAINAAVEAARAGVYGKGFSVVAEEVRALAQRSGNASKETTSMIQGAIKKIDAGAQIANDTENSLQKIVTSSNSITTLVKETADASNDLASGISQINQGMEQISHSTQLNATSADKLADVGVELNQQVKLLKKLMGNFQLKE